MLESTPNTLLFQQEAFNKQFFGVSDSGHSLGAKVSTTSLFQQMKCVDRKTTLHYSKKCPSNIDERFCLEGIVSMSCPVSLTGLWRRNGDLRVVLAICKGFLDLFTQIWSLSGPAVIHKLACSHLSETDLPLYTWGLAYYRDRSLTQTHSEPSVSLLSFYRNRDTLNAPEPSSGMNTTPKFFAESRETENSRLNKLSQMVTYLICDWWADIQKCLKSRV